MRLALAYIIISDSWVASCGLSGVSISSSGERMSVSRRPQFVREVREEFDAGLVKLLVLLFEHHVLPQAAAFAGVAEDKPAHRRQ